MTDALETIIDAAYTTALKHREEGRRVLADQIEAAIAKVRASLSREAAKPPIELDPILNAERN